MKVKRNKELTFNTLVCKFFGKKNLSNKGNALVLQTKIGLGIALLAISTGCVGYVGGGYGVVVPGPDVYVFGGGYERGHDVHDYSHRGFVSRAAAHPSGGHDGRR